MTRARPSSPRPLRTRPTMFCSGSRVGGLDSLVVGAPELDESGLTQASTASTPACCRVRDSRVCRSPRSFRALGHPDVGNTGLCALQPHGALVDGFVKRICDAGGWRQGELVHLSLGKAFRDTSDGTRLTGTLPFSLHPTFIVLPFAARFRAQRRGDSQYVQKYL